MCDDRIVMTNGGFTIGDTTVSGRIVLAPMSGYNDLPFRLLCRRFGASLVYTGLLSAKSIYYSPRTLGSSRTEAMLALHPEEHPVVVQLFAGDGDILAAAAQAIEPLGMVMIDINMGCAKPKVLKSGSGAALMQDAAKVGKIFAGLSRALSVPVSGKIRLGWDDANRNYMDVAQAMVDNGASLIAVHGRTAEQDFTGEADWDAIALAKHSLDIPVLASGDVRTPEDVDRILDATGCDGVMIGRAAIGNPWIFQGIDRFSLPWSERVPVIVEHLGMMVEHHGENYGVSWFRKHLRAYLVGSGVIRRDRHAMMQCKEAARLEALLQAST
jgi:tRNA-dihydrouridine synthase B